MGMISDRNIPDLIYPPDDVIRDNKSRKKYLCFRFFETIQKLIWLKSLSPRCRLIFSCEILLGPMRLLGSMPIEFNQLTGKYELRWQSLSGVYCGIVTAIFVCVTASSCVGAGLVASGRMGNVKYRASNNTSTQQDSTYFYSSAPLDAPEILGIMILLSCFLNCLVQLITMARKGERLTSFLNKWTTEILARGIDPTQHAHTDLLLCSMGTYSIAIVLMACSVYIQPLFIRKGIRTFGQMLTHVPSDWLQKDKTDTIHTCIIIVTTGLATHGILMYKFNLMFMNWFFGLLANSLKIWKTQMSAALNGKWDDENNITLKRFDQLLHDHWKIVRQLRDLENIFALTLQVFYASSVINLCVMLYFLASQQLLLDFWRLEEALYELLVVAQYVYMFMMVSISASRVHDESERCMDCVRRGVPYDIPAEDKHYLEQIVHSISSETLTISANKFFSITKPFILTVVSVAVSYFIIFLQLKLSAET